MLESLIVSQLTYILSPLPTNQCAVDEVNTLFFKFLWNGKGDKIKRDVMISEYEDGRLRDGPLDITGGGGGVKIFSAGIFFTVYLSAGIFFWDTSFARIFFFAY